MKPLLLPRGEGEHSSVLQFGAGPRDVALDRSQFFGATRLQPREQRRLLEIHEQIRSPVKQCVSLAELVANPGSSNRFKVAYGLLTNFPKLGPVIGQSSE